MNKLNSSLM